MEYLKKFDYFPKLSEEVEVKKTSQGGAIFSFFTIIIGALCLIELYTFILGDPIIEPYIDKSRIDEKVRVNLNISLFETPCEALGLDFQDITGSHFEDLQQTIYKLELNKEGYVVDHNKFEEVKKFESKNFHPSHPLWERITGKAASTSCYGAELYEGQQCTTCQDVQKAYQQRRWTMPPLEFIQQCNNVKKSSRTAHAGHLGIPSLTIQLPGHAGHKHRVLSEAGNFTQNPMNLQDLFREENTSQFSLINSLFVVQDVVRDSVFSFDIMRNLCQMPQEAVIEFTYTHYLTNKTKTVQTQPIHFVGGECQTYFPLKIVHAHGQELVLESYLIEGDRLHVKIQDEDDQLFKIRVLDPQNSNAEIPSAIFKRGFGSQNVKGRMLHAEFYGFDDTHPTFVTPMQVAYLNDKIGTGCQIVGTMYVKKVPGNFHISTHHKGLALQHILDKNITARHKIHLLEFTKEDGEITLGKYVKTSNFLDGTMLPPPVAHDIHYYMKIVGSTYKHSIWGEKKFYEYVAHVDVTPKQRNVILLEFKYEFDPISMKYINGRKSLTGFFVSLLAIIGGIFASSTLIDRILERK